MATAPPIPYGYRAIQGQLQKGDGLWDGSAFRKARKNCYPYAGEGMIAIRKCEVVQTEITAESVSTIEIMEID